MARFGGLTSGRIVQGANRQASCRRLAERYSDAGPSVGPRGSTHHEPGPRPPRRNDVDRVPRGWPRRDLGCARIPDACGPEVLPHRTDPPADPGRAGRVGARNGRGTRTDRARESIGPRLSSTGSFQSLSAVGRCGPRGPPHAATGHHPNGSGRLLSLEAHFPVPLAAAGGGVRAAGQERRHQDSETPHQRPAPAVMATGFQDSLPSFSGESTSDKATLRRLPLAPRPDRDSGHERDPRGRAGGSRNSSR